MIKQTIITDEEIKDILLFDEVKDIQMLNVLFGGNGVGKTTFLNAIRDGKVQFILSKKQDVLVKSFTNSIDNLKINIQKKQPSEMKELIKIYNSSGFSEGQTIIHFLLSFLQDIRELETDKHILVLLDEIDSGLSAENINMILYQFKELIEEKNVQFFISSNNYHFVHTLKNVLNMYDGKYMKINSYEEYFDLLQNGIQIMNNSNKRKFNFLDVY